MDSNISTDVTERLGRVLDVDLKLSVKIGELDMKLQSILDLHPGLILELEKLADAPLDLYVGDNVIGHGEVVTIGEKLGIRIIK